MMTVDDCGGDSSISSAVVHLPSPERPNNNNNNNGDNVPTACCTSLVTATVMAATDSDCTTEAVKESAEGDDHQQQSGPQKSAEDDACEIWSDNCAEKVEEDVVSILHRDDELPKEGGSADVKASESRSTDHKMCQTTFELSPHRQSLQVLNLRRRLAEQEEANKRLRLEKDEQLQDISASLMILESQLRRERERIARLLEEKDGKIVEQDRHIQALLRLNRKLAASRQRKTGADAKCSEKKSSRKQRRISWHNEVHVIVDYDRPWSKINYRDCQVSRTLTDPENRTESSNTGKQEDVLCLPNGNVDLDDDDDAADFARAAAEACDAVNKVLLESGDDSVVASYQDLVTHDNFPSPAREDEPIQTNDRRSLSPLQHRVLASGSVSSPSSLGVYNRVMSNHRSVTKPKDVKYKRISRVKSRSLEELRGRLRRHLAHPPVSEHILLETNEEVQ